MRPTCFAQRPAAQFAHRERRFVSEGELRGGGVGAEARAAAGGAGDFGDEVVEALAVGHADAGGLVDGGE